MVAVGIYLSFVSFAYLFIFVATIQIKNDN